MSEADAGRSRAGGVPGAVRWVVVLGAVLLPSFAFPLTITGASVALPDIGDDLGGGPTAAQWVINGYNACFASFLVFTGSLADVVGRRRVFVCGVALFCVSGLASAMAGDIVTLNAVRVFGGVGAAAAATGGSAILAETFTGAARVRVFGLYGTVLGAGLAFGPTIGGLLVDGLGWRAVFAVPAGIAGAALVPSPVLPRAPGERGRAVDWAGAVLFTLALLLLIFAVAEGGKLGFGSPVVVAGVGGAVVLGAVFVVVERRRPDPMFELRLLADRRFSSVAVAAAAIVFVLVPLLVYLPSYFISVMGLGAGEAGAWLLMLTAPAVMLPSVGAVLAKRVPQVVLLAGPVAVTGVGVLSLVTIGPGSTPAGLAVPLLLTGAGFGLSTGLLDGLAVGAVRREQAATATGMFTTARLATETVGIALVGGVLTALSGGRLAGPGYTSALHRVCLALAVFAAASTLCVAAMARRVGPMRRAAAEDVP